MIGRGGVFVIPTVF